MADDEQKYVNDCCDDDVVHSGAVERVKAAMPDEDMLYDAAELFKVFGDSTRTRILSALFIEELCVCDIAEILGMTKSAVSHQLRTLRQTKIVKARRSGKEIFYSLDDDHISRIYKTAMEHLREND
ncbi:MAG TPA: transcriptional regulator [Clostridiales bacterium]|nr:transcriptional regulator [Clostridiales bacterium]